MVKDKDPKQIDEGTRCCLESAIQTEEQGQVKLKGKTQEVRVFTVFIT